GSDDHIDGHAGRAQHGAAVLPRGAEERKDEAAGDDVRVARSRGPLYPTGRSLCRPTERCHTAIPPGRRADTTAARWASTEEGWRTASRSGSGTALPATLATVRAAAVTPYARCRLEKQSASRRRLPEGNATTGTPCARDST